MELIDGAWEGDEGKGSAVQVGVCTRTKQACQLPGRALKQCFALRARGEGLLLPAYTLRYACFTASRTGGWMLRKKTKKGCTQCS